MVFLPGLSAPSPLTMLVSLEGLGWIEKGYIGGSSAVQEHKVAKEQWRQWAAVCSKGAENVIRRGKKSIGLNSFLPAIKYAMTTRAWASFLQFQTHLQAFNRDWDGKDGFFFFLRGLRVFLPLFKSLRLLMKTVIGEGWLFKTLNQLNQLLHKMIHYFKALKKTLNLSSQTRLKLVLD